jgi:hypothetical protein
MFRITKDNGLIISEAVFNLLMHEWEQHEGTLNRGTHVMARAATLGGQSAYRFQTTEEPFKACAWVKQNRVTDGIDVVLGTDTTTYYDEKRGRVPTDEAICICLAYNEHHLAAKAVYEFLVKGRTEVTSDVYKPK